MMEYQYLKARLLYAPKRGVFHWVSPPKEHSQLLGEEAGCVAGSGNGKFYHVIKIDGTKFKRSRLAFLFMTGEFPEDLVDHINGDSLDDRWVNLRPASVLQNAWNHKARRKKSNTSMGVRLLPSGKYCARIGCNGVQHSLGSFETEVDAVAAYQAARRRFFGEFA